MPRKNRSENLSVYHGFKFVYLMLLSSACLNFFEEWSWLPVFLFLFGGIVTGLLSLFHLDKLQKKQKNEVMQQEITMTTSTNMVNTNGLIGYYNQG